MSQHPQHTVVQKLPKHLDEMAVAGEFVDEFVRGRRKDVRMNDPVPIQQDN